MGRPVARVRRLFNAFDVDFDQWKALTTVALKLDFRLSAAGRPQRGGETRLACCGHTVAPKRAGDVPRPSRVSNWRQKDREVAYA